MATKKTNTSKVKAASKPSAKEKTAEKPSKADKAAKAPKVPKVEAKPAKPEPKMMSGKVSKEEKPAPVKKKTKAELNAEAEAAKADAEWVQYMNQNRASKPVPYVMSDDYQPKSVISHKVLGLGYVLKSQNNRIEVAFKDGKKTLITNYKK